MRGDLGRLALLLLLLAGCSIEKPFSQADFPCSAGGLCVPDSGVMRDAGFPRDATPPEDAGFPDAAPMDADPMDVPPVDTGPPIACPEPVELPASGGVSNATTIEASNHVDGSGRCFAPGGRDIVYYFNLPGHAKSMTFVAANPTLAAFIPALHLYRDSCQPMDELACAAGDDFDFQARIDARDLVPGDYAIVVDGIDTSNAGMFNLVVDGVIRAGELCDERRTSFRCEVGACTDGACPKLQDCPDTPPVDADGDGMTDEDACDDPTNTPPQVTCNTTATAVPGQLIQLMGTAVDDAMVAGREWEIVAQPNGSRARIANGNQDNVSFRIDLAGTYRARFRAWDAEYQTSACEVIIDANPVAALYVEAYWLDEPFDSFDMDLTLIHPDADNWYDEDPDVLSCTTDTFCDPPPDWGVAGPDLDPSNDPVWSGDSAENMIAAESISILSPQLIGNYGVGVFAFAGDPRQLFVNVYCYGSLARTFSSTVPVIRDNFDEGDFWKVVDVQFGLNACTLTELGTVVTRDEAEAVR